MIVDGPADFPEIAAISNSKGLFSFGVSAEGIYLVKYFLPDGSEKTTRITTGHKKDIRLD